MQDELTVELIESLKTQLAAAQAKLVEKDTEERRIATEFSAYKEGFAYGAAHPEHKLTSPDPKLDILPDGAVSESVRSDQTLRIEWSRGCDDALTARWLGHDVDAMLAAEILGPSLYTTIHIVRAFQDTSYAVGHLSNLERELTVDRLRSKLAALVEAGEAILTFEAPISARQEGTQWPAFRQALSAAKKE